MGMKGFPLREAGDVGTGAGSAICHCPFEPSLVLFLFCSLAVQVLHQRIEHDWIPLMGSRGQVM